MKTQLQEAISHLYTTFKPYNIIGSLRDRSCDCCVNNDEIKTLLSKPLKELSKDDIYHFMTSAITTFGDVEDYKHFLPRILELVAFSSNIRDDFLTFEKLNYTKWLDWENTEVKAIKSFFEECLLYALNTNSYKINDFIALNLSYNDFETLKAILLASNSKKLIFDIVENTILTYTYPIDDRLIKLYSSQTILDKIEQLFLNTENTEEANRLSIAYSILERNK